MTLQRFLALLILLIPGFIAGYGIKQMRDTLFQILNQPYPSLTLQFIVGFFAMIVGVAFIGGFILHRDRKRNKVQTRFQKPQ
ncbi:DUF2627 domain-containing protein [Texcoconibacillus texcoconensis]|uniref:TRAP-type C4-dicarboxylate transport system permease small subunit n=1 Tax=Texcoconibacillus texcoconensis TaxID=1095777 RepID=A0A840QNX8_9BACI|nr:DUF2627 domain-containing protein [Texcoconibacillus texcoconensis]MBB5173051.1 TRAP-type C4-dicarboxylate transport system permease small subunit [Texcoconibacillus texcoconensis]